MLRVGFAPAAVMKSRPRNGACTLPMHARAEMADVQDMLSRIWENLAARPSGPLAFRFLVQPSMAAIFAIRDGIRDARTGRSPHLWTVLTNPQERGGRLRENMAATAKIMILAVILDAIYQFEELDKFYPGEALIVALVLAFIPYLLIRGPAARLARGRVDRSSADKTG